MSIEFNIKGFSGLTDLIVLNHGEVWNEVRYRRKLTQSVMRCEGVPVPLSYHGTRSYNVQ